MTQPALTPDQKMARDRHRLKMGGMVIGCFLVGILGGVFGIFLVNNYFSLNSNRSHRVVLEENSAIIEVAKELSPSVVSITTESAQLDPFGRPISSQGAGTGIVISKSGLILTNKHVVADGAGQVTVTTNDGKRYTGARVLARDPQLDLAYLKIDAKDLRSAELGDSDQVVVGQKVIAIGNALGEFQNTVTAGIISGLGRPVTASEGSSDAEQLQNLLQTDAAINPGNSGGPLVNIEGQVIGVNTAIAGDAENIGFAIPINQAKAGIASIEGSGKLVKPYLGVRYVALTKEIADANNLTSDNGAWLKGDGTNPAIIPGGPAAKAGLKEGDIIIKVNGTEINQTRSLQTLIGSHKVGDTVKITVLRDNKPVTVSVKLDQLPE